MRVSERVHRDATTEVEVSRAVCCEQRATGAALEGDRRPVVDRHEMRTDDLLHGIWRNEGIGRVVRGSGLLVGLQCLVPHSDVIALAHTEQLLCLSAGSNVLRLAPPLIITDDEIDEGIARLSRVAARLSR